MQEHYELYICQISCDQSSINFLHLIPDFSYLVKLNGYWSLDSSDVASGGFIMYTIFINSSPRNTSLTPCFVFPSRGVSMKTLFTVKCEDGGIVDPDLPLLYQWYYRTNRTMNWKSITYPSEGWTFFVHEFCLSARNVSAVDFDKC